MYYRTQRELYLALLPVLSVKQRINAYYGYNVSKEKIWKYLGCNKWKNTVNLSLSEIVNDIIVLDMFKVKWEMIGNE